MTQEQIEKALEEHINRELSDKANGWAPYLEADIRMAFREGAELANKYWQEKTRWVSIQERLPPIGVEVLFQNDKWIEKSNPRGIRIGFLGEYDVYYSAYYSTFSSDYYCNKGYVDGEIPYPNNQIPTKWKEID